MFMNFQVAGGILFVGSKEAWIILVYSLAIYIYVNVYNIWLW